MEQRAEAADDDSRGAVQSASGKSTLRNSAAPSARSPTARGWEWARWTPFATRAAKRRTFSTSAAARRPNCVRKSYALVVSDPRVKALFINIFGGITRGDQVARGIVEALAGQATAKSTARHPLDRYQCRRRPGDFGARRGWYRSKRWTKAPPRRSRWRGSRRREPMAIFLDKNSKVIVQGITGREGAFHTARDARVRNEHRRRRYAR